MKKLLVAGVLLLAAAVTTGCTATSAGLAPSSTPTAGKEFTVIGDASGSGYAVVFLGIPLSGTNPTASARDNCLRDSGADGIINATVDTRLYNLGPLLVQRTQVSGKAIKFTN